MKQGALQTALATGAGILLALAAGRVLAQMLFQVSPADALSFSGQRSCFPPPRLSLVSCRRDARRALLR